MCKVINIFTIKVLDNGHKQGQFIDTTTYLVIKPTEKGPSYRQPFFGLFYNIQCFFTASHTHHSQFSQPLELYQAHLLHSRSFQYQ